LGRQFNWLGDTGSSKGLVSRSKRRCNRFAVIGLLCSTLSIQALDVVNALPKYRENICARWEAIQKGPPGPLNLAFHNLDALILVGLWSLPAEGAARWVKRIKDSSGSEIYTNIDEAVRGIASRARPKHD
jgi:hypothetical protein